MQGTISKDLMKSAVKEVWIRSLTEIQPDILEALNAAREKRPMKGAGSIWIF